MIYIAQCEKEIRIKTKFYNKPLICAHATTEQKDDLTKDGSHLWALSQHDVKIVIGDLSAKVTKKSKSQPPKRNIYKLGEADQLSSDRKTWSCCERRISSILDVQGEKILGAEEESKTDL